MKKINGPIKPNAYILPHHGVLRENHSITKLKIVLNATFKIEKISEISYSTTRLLQVHLFNQLCDQLYNFVYIGTSSQQTLKCIDKFMSSKYFSLPASKP